MSENHSVSQQEYLFWFEEIAAFNARGLLRCRIPGCGISGTNFGAMDADCWRNRQQQVLIRFSWAGWTYHFRVLHFGGGQVLDPAIDALFGCVEEILCEWLGDAPDVPPTVPMDPDLE